MNGTQNRKIEQVTEQILVIGMDIAKHKPNTNTTQRWWMNEEEN